MYLYVYFSRTIYFFESVLSEMAKILLYYNKSRFLILGKKQDFTEKTSNELFMVKQSSFLINNYQISKSEIYSWEKNLISPPLFFAQNFVIPTPFFSKIQVNVGSFIIVV